MWSVSTIRNNLSKTLKVCTLLSEVEAPCAMQVGERERTKGKGETETRENLSQSGEINSEGVIMILATKTVLKIFQNLHVTTKGVCLLCPDSGTFFK